MRIADDEALIQPTSLPAAICRQRIYRQYAAGEISASQVASLTSELEDLEGDSTWRFRIASALYTVIRAALAPSLYRREN